MINRRSFLLGTTSMVAAASMPSLTPAITSTVDPLEPATQIDLLSTPNLYADWTYAAYERELMNRVFEAFLVPRELLEERLP